MSDSPISTGEAKAIAGKDGRPVGERYLALKRLEQEDPQAALRQAEHLVVRAGDSRDGRFLAVNALGTLSRVPGGRAALERLSDTAPTEELRDAAHVLLGQSKQGR